MPKMRTLSEAVRCIKEADPESAFTVHALRAMVLAGKFPFVSVGTKRLINVDLLQKFLSGEFTPIQQEPAESGVIRPLPEKWGGSHV